MMKINTLAIWVLILLVGCQREEEMISGAITGWVATYKQDFTLYPDQSGVHVFLCRDSAILDSTTTDSNGRYAFQDIPYGKYAIDYRKYGFIKTWGYQPVHHIGGYSPTLASFRLHEVPNYEIQLDSVQSSHEFYNMTIYLRINGDTVVPAENFYGYSFIGFASNEPAVTSSHFHARIRGYLQDYKWAGFPYPCAVFGLINTWEVDLEELASDTIYLRVYPLAIEQGYWPHEYYPGALGRPSNVLSFKMPE